VAIAVEVWRVELRGTAPPSATDLDVLSADERDRHDSYLAAESARIFASTRLALRGLLGRRLACDPRDVRIEVDSRGKPSLANSAWPFFNVSHGSSAALIALCDAGAVGVDVESGLADDAASGLPSLVCTPAELAWLAAHRAEAAETIARLWCRKEAVLKAEGVGLARPMSDVELGDPALRHGSAKMGEGLIARWCDLALPVAERGAVAVLATASSKLQVSLRSWTN